MNHLQIDILSWQLPEGELFTPAAHFPATPPAGVYFLKPARDI